MPVSYTINNGFCIINGKCTYNGKQIPNPPKFRKNFTNLTTIDDKVYLNGWEYFHKERKWKRTPAAIWHYLTNIFW